MTQLTTWNNNPRECWVEDNKGKLTRKFIVFYDPMEDYAIDKQGNRYDTVYEITDLSECTTFEEFKSEFIADLDNKKLSIESVLKKVGEWFNNTYLPNHDKEVRQETYSPIISRLYELRNNYDTTKVENNFRYSLNELHLCKEFVQKLNEEIDILNKLEIS